ncbi:MAG: hypothetical protein ACKOAU_20390 [Pirellula sp.]
MKTLSLLVVGAPDGFTEELKQHFARVESISGEDARLQSWIDSVAYQKDVVKNVPFFRTPSIRIPVDPSSASVIVFYELFLRTRNESTQININYFKSVAHTTSPPAYLVVVAACFGVMDCREFLANNRLDCDGVFDHRIDAFQLNNFLVDLSNSRYRWITALVKGSNTGFKRFITWRYILPSLFAAVLAFLCKAYLEEIGKSAGGATWKYFTEKPTDKSNPPGNVAKQKEGLPNKKVDTPK